MFDPLLTTHKMLKLLSLKRELPALSLAFTLAVKNSSSPRPLVRHISVNELGYYSHIT